jgi:hypothetical protein
MDPGTVVALRQCVPANRARRTRNHLKSQELAGLGIGDLVVALQRPPLRSGQRLAVDGARFTVAASLLIIWGGPDGEYCCVRAAFRVSADIDLLDAKACGEEVLTHCVHGPVVRGRDRVREWFPGGTIEESEKNAAFGLHATGKLAKNKGQFGWRKMDQRIPSENACQVSVRNS